MKNTAIDDKSELLKQSISTIQGLRKELENVKNEQNEPIAVIGMGCRFPGGCNTPDEYWEFLKNGGDGAIDIPADRWNIDDYYDPVPGKTNKMYVRKSNFLTRDISQFDAKFFQISPAEANEMDPQQRQLLEVCWEALENAGQNPVGLRGSNTGVFLGISSNGEYGKLPQDQSKLNQYVGTGNNSSIASGRISYLYGWNGPSISIDTACSSSLVSTHLAAASLRKKECDMAVSAGVSLMISPVVMSSLCSMNAIAADGRSKPFDADGNGYGRGEGCGVLILKRLSDAKRDNDTIYAVIEGSALNNDGDSSGLTVPNGKAQKMVISEALKAANVKPEDVDYIEAHGTGTPLGDPIEFDAIKEVYFGKNSAKRERDLVVGAVKGNIGHLESAAGVSSIIKVILSLNNKEMPPIANFKNLNPRMNVKDTSVVFPTKRLKWENTDNKKRIAGVSSFGFSGTNGHMIISEGLELKNAGIRNMEEQLLFLSAKEEERLIELIRKYKEYFEQNPDMNVGEVCFTTNACRAKYTQCAVFIGKTIDDFIKGFNQLLEYYDQNKSIYITKTELIGSSMGEDRLKAKRTLFGNINDTIYTSSIDDMIKPKLAFIFNSDNGALIQSAIELYNIFDIFKAELEQCFEYFKITYDTIEDDFINFASNKPKDEISDAILFSVEYAFMKMLESFGVTPEVTFGERYGVYVAAVTAGIISLESAVKLFIAEQKMQEGSNIRYVRVFTARDELEKLIGEYKDDVCISAVYSKTEAVISVKASAYDSVLKSLMEKGIELQEEQSKWPSKLLDDKLEEYKNSIENVEFTKPRYRYASASSKNTLRNLKEISDDIRDKNIISTTEYDYTVESLYQQGYRFFVELGKVPAKQKEKSVLDKEDVVTIHFLQDEDAMSGVLKLLAQCIGLGCKIKWNDFYKGYVYRKIVLPNYPFADSKYWITPPSTECESFDTQSRMSEKFIGKEIKLPYPQKQFRFLFSHDNFREIIDNSGVIHVGYYVEMLKNVMDQAYEDKNYTVNNIEFINALMIFEGENKEIILTLDSDDDIHINFKFYSKNIEQDSWNLNVKGELTLIEELDDSLADIDTIRKSCSGANSTGEDFYKLLEEERGFYFGHSVRWVDEIWQNRQKALIRFRKNTEQDGNINYGLGIHPGILDSLAQTCNYIAIPDTPAGKKYMVTTINNVTINNINCNNTDVFGFVEMKEFNVEKGVITGALELFNEIGARILTAESIQLKEFDEERLGMMREMMSSNGKKEGKDDRFLMQYMQADNETKLTLLTEYVRNIMADVLECKPEDIGLEEPIDNLGLDSMSGLHFYNKTTELLGVEMPFSDLAQCKNMTIAAKKISQLLPGSVKVDLQELDEPEAEVDDMSIEHWIYDYKPNKDAKIRLFCFPNGFRSADMFSEWQKKLGSDIHVCAIKIPGLDIQRIKEPAPVEVDEFMKKLEEVLDNAGLLDIPCTSFGHSWGSLFSYRLAYRLMNNPKAKYVKLFISGYTSPTLKNSSIVKILDEIKAQGFRNIPAYDAIRNDSEAIELISKAYHKVWDYDEKSTKAVLQLLLSACGLIDRYHHNFDEKFDVPIIGFHGIDDYVVDIEEMNAWENITSSSFKLYTMAGDHQFVNENQSEERLLSLIKEEISNTMK